MNPILVLSAFGVAILLWFVLAFTFKPIGILFGKLFADAIEAMAHFQRLWGITLQLSIWESD